MKILIDPKLAVFIKDMTDKQCAELLRCIFEYPNRECDLGLWVYMKKQIQEDEKRYKEKCDRMAMNRAMKSQQKSKLKSEQISKVRKVVVVEKENKDKENKNKGSESSNANIPVENSVEKGGITSKEFFVGTDFSFEKIIDEEPKFAEYLQTYPAPVIERADKTFQKKRKGQWITIYAVLEWLEQENRFYKEKLQ